MTGQSSLETVSILLRSSCVCVFKLLVTCSINGYFVLSSRGVVGILGVTTQRRHYKFAVCCDMQSWTQIARTCTYSSRAKLRTGNNIVLLLQLSLLLCGAVALSRCFPRLWDLKASITTSPYRPIAFLLQCVNGYLTLLGCTVSTFRRGWKWWPGIFPWLEWDVANILKPFACRMQGSPLGSNQDQNQRDT